MALRSLRRHGRPSAEVRQDALEARSPEALALRKATHKAEAETKEALQERRDEELDAAVAWQLERMASDATFDAPPARPKDPYAVHVGFRLDEGLQGGRYLVLHASKATPTRDELRIEFQKRLD